MVAVLALPGFAESEGAEAEDEEPPAGEPGEGHAEDFDQAAELELAEEDGNAGGEGADGGVEQQRHPGGGQGGVAGRADQAAESPGAQHAGGGNVGGAVGADAHKGKRIPEVTESGVT